MDLIADTTFLVGLWRKQAWAMDFAKENPRKSLGLPWIVLGEFWHGAVRAGHDAELVRRFLDLGLPILDPRPVIPVYAEVCAGLQARDAGAWRMIGQNDLWIAAAALAHGVPLLTRNIRHFGKIEGLKVEVAGGGQG